MIVNELKNVVQTVMRKRRTLSDLYHFPGCRPKKIVRGVFGDPHAGVIPLVRRGKKLLAGYAVRFIEPTVLAKSAGSAIFPAGAPGFTLNWKSGASCVVDAER
jgi:hypothetical protein